MRKPIRVFYSPLSEKFFACSRYKERDGVYIVTGEKDDVTNDIARAVVEYEIEFSAVDWQGTP